MHRWIAALVLALSFLLTGCSTDQGHYAVVYPYTVTVGEQEFTFSGPHTSGGFVMEDAKGQAYHFRRFTLGSYRVIQIFYPDDVKYTWKQDKEDTSIIQEEYTGAYDADTHIPGPVLVEAIRTPAPQMEYVPPQKTPLNEKKFPWVGLLLAIYGLLRLAFPEFDLYSCYCFFHQHWHWHVKIDDPSESDVRWAHIEGAVCVGIGALFFLHYFFF